MRGMKLLRWEGRLVSKIASRSSLVLHSHPKTLADIKRPVV